jgi:hypothetical protein
VHAVHFPPDARINLSVLALTVAKNAGGDMHAFLRACQAKLAMNSVLSNALNRSEAAL